MVVFEVRVPPGVDLSPLETVVEAACASEGLCVRRKTTMATYPGSMHWHVTRESGPGTLEVTVWPKGQRVWLKVHPRRSAPWIEEMAPKLTDRLESGVVALASARSRV